jgi:hypothetical protein
MRISVLLAVNIAVWAQGCASSTDTTQTTAAALTVAQGDVEGAQDSLSAARDAAKACFDTFKTCKAATDADVNACKDALKACLPADAPKARTCGGHGHHDGDRDASVPPAPSAPPAPPSASAPPPAPSGAVPPPDGQRQGPGHGPDGKECGRPPVRDGGVKKCGDKAAVDLDVNPTDSTVDSTAADHDGCVASVFNVDAIVPPADVCAVIASRCAAQ